MLTGQNGILTQASKADTATIQGEVQEKINLALNEVYTKILSGEATITAPTIDKTDNKPYTVSEINKTGATVVTISYTGDAEVGTYEGKITYAGGAYTIEKAAKK